MMQAFVLAYKNTSSLHHSIESQSQAPFSGPHGTEFQKKPCVVVNGERLDLCHELHVMVIIKVKYNLVKC